MQPRFNIVQALTLLSADALLLQHQRPTAGSDTVNMKREEGPLNLLLDCVLFKRMAPRSSFKGGIPDIDHLYRTSCTIKQSYNVTKCKKKKKPPPNNPTQQQIMWSTFKDSPWGEHSKITVASSLLNLWRIPPMVQSLSMILFNRFIFLKKSEL